jgi:imidazolonepropionase-like amidohydrolase
MRDMIALAKELDYKLVLDGVQEAWLIPDELKKADVQVVLTPRNRRRPTPGKEETTGSSIETSGKLEHAGVPFAVAPLGTAVSLDGIAGRDLTSLMLEAAFAVRGGASEETALAALTITPARMLGLEKRIGSIEEGKDADLLILNGPPLDYRTVVDKAFVAGKVYYDRARTPIYPEPAAH